MLSLRDRLAHLTYREACGLLGHQGESLLRQGGKYDLDISDQVKWEDHSLRVDLGEAVVTVALDPQKRKGLRFSCSRCPQVCEHSGAAFALILEEKLSLGLSAPPPEIEPLEMLSDEELVRQAIEEREERARTEKMKWKSMDPNELWTDYAVTNNYSGKPTGSPCEAGREGTPIVRARISGRIPWEHANIFSSSAKGSRKNSAQERGIPFTSPTISPSIFFTGKRWNCAFCSPRIWTRAS